MPKVGTVGIIHFPKGMSRLDQAIVKKIFDIRKTERKLLEIKQEIIDSRKLLLNLQARQKILEDRISENQDELFKMYDDKLCRDTVAFNR